MKKIAVLFKLKDPSCREGYEYAHKNLPQEMREILTLAGIKNYTIWNYKTLLFGYYECEDPEKTNEILKASPVFAPWRKQMEQYVYMEPVTNQKEWDLELLFEHQ